MKSVGEVMAIGRTFQESISKALRSLETGLDGFNEQLTLPLTDEGAEKLSYELRWPGPNRFCMWPTRFAPAGLCSGYSRPQDRSLVPAQIEDLLREEAQLVKDGSKASSCRACGR